LFGRLSTALYNMTKGERDNDNIIQLTIVFRRELFTKENYNCTKLGLFI